MSPGVVSLRCPACGRPFLSLPQQTEARIACPHCRSSAEITVFRPASASLPESIAAPLRRQVIQQAATTPAPTRPVPSAFLGGSLSWSHSPEAGPVPADSDARWSSPFPLAPPAEPQWPTQALSTEAFDEDRSPTEQDAAPTSPFLRPEPVAAEEVLHARDPARESHSHAFTLFVLIVFGFAAWLLWDSLQPPLHVTIPAVQHPNPAPAAPFPVPSELPTPETLSAELQE